MTAEILDSRALNTAVGIATLAVPTVAYLLRSDALKDIALVAVSVVLAGYVAFYYRHQSSHLCLRRARASETSNEEYFGLVRHELEKEVVEHHSSFTDGFLPLFSAEVPRMSLLLYRTLTESSIVPKRVLATDLTKDPNLHLQRREYLRANRRLIEAGGSVQRVFICRGADLRERAFAERLMELVSTHRDVGVTCGLAVEELLAVQDRVDFVVWAAGAVLVEEDQANFDFTTGRSTVYFRHIPTWVERFDRIWLHNETAAAEVRLQRYEAAVRPMLEGGDWDPPVVE